MNFKDFYQPGKTKFSFEIFPPRDSAGVNQLLNTLRELTPFKPAYISVTYGAMGSTQDLTRDLVISIQKDISVPTAFHFTCVGSNRTSIRNYVEKLKAEGLNLIVALRGDPPAGSSQFVKPADGFGYANELVAYLKELGGFSLAVAGYPEGHIESTSKEADIQNLARKVAAGADVVITQLFFDNNYYYDFVDRARKAGIQVPIIAGIMPVLNVKQIERITKLCGASLPDSLHKKLEESQDNAEKVLQLGIEHATRQCEDLIKNNVPGIHLYTLNKAYSTRKILEALQKN